MTKINVELTTKQKNHDYFQEYYAKNKEKIAERRRLQRLENKKKVIHTCVICGKEISPSSKNRKYCSDECRAIGNRLVNEKYKMTEHAKEVAKKYRMSESYKRARAKYVGSDKWKESQKRYVQSEKGKATRAKYYASEQYKESQRRYTQSEKGKATRNKYEQSEKGKENHRRYYIKRKGQPEVQKILDQEVKPCYN